MFQLFGFYTVRISQTKPQTLNLVIRVSAAK